MVAYGIAISNNIVYFVNIQMQLSEIWIWFIGQHLQGLWANSLLNNIVLQIHFLAFYLILIADLTSPRSVYTESI